MHTNVYREPGRERLTLTIGLYCHSCERRASFSAGGMNAQETIDTMIADYGWTKVAEAFPRCRVHGWFCSPTCLASPEGDRARVRAAAEPCRPWWANLIGV